MKRPLPYSRKLRQFQHLAEKLNRLLKDHSFHQLNQKAQQALISRFRHLFQQIKTFLTAKRLRAILAGAAVLLGIGITQDVAAQVAYLPPVVNPFGINAAVGDYAIPAVVDIDGDGDLDLFSANYASYGDLSYYENTGTSTAPSFNFTGLNPFGLVQIPYVPFPTFADIDNDGDQDLFVGTYEGITLYFQNTGTSTAPAFATLQVNPFGIDSIYQFAFPTAGDLDNDGDIDLLYGEYYGAFQYFENTGTASAPAFAAPVADPFGLDSVYYFAFPDLHDIDQDGDLDLLAGAYTEINYFENVGTASNPQFGFPSQNPFGLQAPVYNGFPQFADLDGDGDSDLLMGEANGVIFYYEDTTVVVGRSQPFPAGEISLYPNPATETLTLELELTSPLSDAKLEVLDFWGRVLWEIQTHLTSAALTQSIPLHSLKPGIHFVRIRSDEFSWVGKFLKE